MTVQITPQKHALATDKRAGTEMVTECLRTTVFTDDCTHRMQGRDSRSSMFRKHRKQPQSFFGFYSVVPCLKPFSKCAAAFARAHTMTFWGERYVYS